MQSVCLIVYRRCYAVRRQNIYVDYKLVPVLKLLQTLFYSLALVPKIAVKFIY